MAKSINEMRSAATGVLVRWYRERRWNMRATMTSNKAQAAPLNKGCTIS
jgi:hypothetical protein